MALLNDDKLRFPGMGTDPQSVRQRVEAMEHLLERMFVIPGINRPVGLDVILARLVRPALPLRRRAGLRQRRR